MKVVMDRPEAQPLFRSKKDAVLGALRSAILRGDLKPGQRLVIDDLATQYGISAIPVREALQQLQSDGLVQIQLHIGASVSQIEPNVVQEIFDLLESLERMSARRASERMTKTQFAQMEAMLGEMDGSFGDLEAWSAMNAQLHTFICDCAEMPLTKNMLTQVLDHWNRLRKVYLAEVHSKRAHLSQKEHWQMYRAMKAGDLERLDRVIREHNRAACEAYTCVLQRALSDQRIPEAAR